MASFLGNVGAVARGVTAQQEAEQKLGLEKLQLSEAQRQMHVAQTEREAVSAADQETGLVGAYMAMANQKRQNGDLQGYQTASDALQALHPRAKLQLAQDILQNTDPKQAEQDLVSIYGTKFIKPGSLEYGTDPKTQKHMASIIDPSTGQRKVIMDDAANIIAMQQKPVVVPKGSVVMRGSNVIGENPEAGANASVGTYYQTGPNAGKVVSKAQPRRTESYRYNMTPAQGDKLKNQKALDAELMMQPGMAETNMQTGIKQWTQKGIDRSPLAYKLARAHPELSQSEIADMAVNGSVMKSTARSGMAAVMHKGKIYEYPEDGQQTTSPPASSLTAPPANNAADEASDEENNENFARGGMVKKYARGGNVNSKGLC